MSNYLPFSPSTLAYVAGGTLVVGGVAYLLLRNRGSVGTTTIIRNVYSESTERLSTGAENAPSIVEIQGPKVKISLQGVKEIVEILFKTPPKSSA